MKRIVIILITVCFSAVISAQTDIGEEQEAAWATKFKPRYAGTSVDAGFMFSPNFGGSAFFIAPKIQFQTTPRLFVNAGVGIVQYNMPPSQNKLEGTSQQQQRTALTGSYVFVEGLYLLNERWSLNGSMMKNTTPETMRMITPYRIPNEAAHFGIDFKVTPNISIGTSVRYSN